MPVLILLLLASDPLVEHPTIKSMLEESNRIRAASGLKPQILDENLCQAAQGHAVYMANTGSFFHGDYQGRATRAGFKGWARENIAMGQHGVKSVFHTWRNSGGHYASIVCSADKCGFGLAYRGGTPYWVAVYGKDK